MTDQQLIQRIRDTALLHGEFTLRSGKTSRYYLDKYRFETEPDILRALGERFARFADEQVDRLAGAVLGGIPLVTATALATGKPTVLIRAEKKDYGTAQQIEGVLNEGDRVLLIEDVATTGGQVLEAAQMLTELGASVSAIVAVIDREEGARQNIEEAGYRFERLLTKSDLGINEN
jgi:orotate phosphoribosyltransferase